ncbi:MAG: hypothetical protein H0U87_08970 [Acidobacteria bacterium]|nr:hypothetical protein [Acidobacteriota bacterium]
MKKTRKELAFLRDLYVAPDWTERFTKIFDENFKFTDEKNILYINAGTGDHAIELNRKLKKNQTLKIFGADAELNRIAQAKADIVKAKIDFSDAAPSGEIFDAVLADASFVKPNDLPVFLKEVIDLSNRQVAFFLPTASSFGDIFSFLWETLLHLDLLEKSAEVERLITEIPTVSKVEEMAENLGLTKIEIAKKDEFFDFKDGAEFVNSPLVTDFLFPAWLDFLTEKEKERVGKRLVQIIDAEDGILSFRLTVKATLFVGEKAENK